MYCPKCGTENPDNGKFCRSCGNALGNAAAEISGFYEKPEIYRDKKGRIKSTDPADVIGHGVKDLLMGIGFAIFSYVLFSTNLWGGSAWWWAMLFPAFGSFAKGVSEIVRYQVLKKRTGLPENRADRLNQYGGGGQTLPHVQTEFITPQKSEYETGELRIPPSVTEDTTRHLQINTEGETMTLPKK